MKNKMMKNILENDHSDDTLKHLLKSILLDFPEKKQKESIKMLSELLQPFDDMLTALKNTDDNEFLMEGLDEEDKELKDG